MRKELIYWDIFVLFLLSSQLQAQTDMPWNSETSFYFYTPDSDAEKLVATTVSFDNTLTKEEILDSEGYYLSSTYFVIHLDYIFPHYKLLM